MIDIGPHISRAIGLQVGILGRGRMVTIEHIDTGEIIERPGYHVSSRRASDPIGDRTEFQSVPRFHVSDVPWDGETMQGDKLTDHQNQLWQVVHAEVTESGGGILFVEFIGSVQ